MDIFGAPRAARSRGSRLAAVGLVCVAPALWGGCGSGDLPATVAFSWSLSRQADGDPVKAPVRSCTDVGIETIRLELNGAGTMEFACKSTAAQTLTVKAGYYHVRISALGAGSILKQTVEYPNYYVFGQSSLGLVRLAIP